MYMDDIKLFPQNEQELETLIQALTMYSQDIGMEFGIEKCTMLIMKSRTRQMTPEIELSNQEKNRTLGEKETYKYLGILEANTIKQTVMKENIEKEYLRRTEILRKTELHRRNIIRGIYTCAVLFVRYSWPFLKWTKEGRQRMDRRTRNLRTMHKALYL